MMRRTLVVNLLIFIVRSTASDLADERTTDVGHVTYTLTDKLRGRSTMAPFLHEADLDDTTSGKQSTFPRLVRSRIQTSSLRVPKGLRRGMQKPEQFGPQRAQRLVTLRASESDAEPNQANMMPGERHFSAIDAFTKKFGMPKSIGEEIQVLESAHPMSLRVECAPEEEGGECELTFEIKITLEPASASAVHWRQMTRQKDGTRVIVVDRLAEESEAYRRGMRPGMIVKAMSDDSGRLQDEPALAAMKSPYFEAILSLAHRPINFVMLEGVKVSGAARITE